MSAPLTNIPKLDLSGMEAPEAEQLAWRAFVRRTWDPEMSDEKCDAALVNMRSLAAIRRRNRGGRITEEGSDS